METVEYQSFVFLYTLYGGILIGILFDIYRALKGTKKSEKLITSLWDIAFLFAVLFIIISTLFSSNYGDLRAYVFVGFAVGFFLYEKILSRIAYGLFVYIKRNIIGFFRTTNSILLLPFKVLINLLWYPVGKIALYLKKKRVKLRRLKKLPQNVIKSNKKYINLIIRKRNKNIT